MDMYLEFAANHTLLVTALLFSFFLLVFTELRRQARSFFLNVKTFVRNNFFYLKKEVLVPLKNLDIFKIEDFVFFCNSLFS